MIDAMAPTRDQQFEAVVNQAFLVHARAHAELVQQVDVTCSSTPARMRPSTYSALWRSTITASMPALCSSWPSSSPEGPAPMIATWVRMDRPYEGRNPAATRKRGSSSSCITPGERWIWADCALRLVLASRDLDFSHDPLRRSGPTIRAWPAAAPSGAFPRISFTARHRARPTGRCCTWRPSRRAAPVTTGRSIRTCTRCCTR